MGKPKNKKNKQKSHKHVRRPQPKKQSPQPQQQQNSLFLAYQIILIIYLSASHVDSRTQENVEQSGEDSTYRCWPQADRLFDHGLFIVFSCF